MLAQKVVVTKFDVKLTSEVAESSRHSNPVDATIDLIEKLVVVNNPGRAANFLGNIFIFIIIYFFYRPLVQPSWEIRLCGATLTAWRNR